MPREVAPGVFYHLRAEIGLSPTTAPRTGVKTSLRMHYTTGQELGRTDVYEWIRALDRFHRSRGWTHGLGYNHLYGIDRNPQVGHVYEGRGFERVGAHTPGYNTTGHGLCFLGNDDPGDDLTPGARRAAAWVRLRCAKSRGVGYLAFPTFPHSATRATLCPGDEIRAWIRAGMPTVPYPTKDADMSQYGPENWDAKDIAAFQKKLGWGTPMSSMVSDWTGPVSAIVRTTHKYAVLGQRQTAANAAALTVLASALADGTLTAEQIVQRVEQAIAEAVVSVDVTVTGEDTP
jgi:hypothetical protein